MVSSTLIAAALGALPFAFAGYHVPHNVTASYSTGPTGTAKPASPAIQTVAVGQNGLTFTPDTIHAEVGQEITFQFFPKNHSVVQADFNNPCNPSSAGGFFSGFIPSTSGPANQTFTITVENKKPIWLYCAALRPAPHCAAGMVAVINPPASGPNTLEAFRALAARTNTSTVPTTVGGGDIESSTPIPSATSTGAPVQFTGAASAYAIGTGAIGGLMAVFAAALMM